MSTIGDKLKNRRVILEISRFGSIYGEILSDIWRNQRLRMILTVSLGVIAALCQGVTILVLVKAGKVLNPSSGPADAIEAGDNRVVLLLEFGGILLVAGLFSAWATWKFIQLCRKIGRELQEGLVLRMLRDLNRISPAEMGEIPKRCLKNPSLPFMRGALITGLAADILLQTVRPATLTGGLLLSLVAVDWRFMVVAGFFLLIPAPSILFLNRRTRSVSDRFYGEERINANGEIQDIVKELNAGSLLSDPIKHYQESDGIRKMHDDYDFFKTANSRGQFISDFFRSILAPMGLLGFGFAAASGMISWSVMLAGLLAVVRLQQGASALISQSTSLVRYTTIVSETQRFAAALKGGGAIAHSNNQGANGDSVNSVEPSSHIPKAVLAVTDLKPCKTTVAHILQCCREKSDFLSFQDFSVFCIPKHEVDNVLNDADPWRASVNLVKSNRIDPTALVVLPAPYTTADDLSDAFQEVANPVMILASRWEGELDSFDEICLVKQSEQAVFGNSEFWEPRKKSLMLESQSAQAEEDELENLLG